MSISHDGITFGGDATPFQQGPVLAPIQVEAYPGLIGESHLIDPVKGAEFWCAYTLKGYASAAAIHAAIASLQRYAGQLTGTVTRTGNAAATIANCTYLGFEITEPPRAVWGTTSGWMARGILRWRQRRI